MSESSVLVKIAKPIASNKRFFGLVTVALIVIGSLGALYYFYIDGNKVAYKEYRLQILDNFYDRIDRQFDNLVISVDAKEHLKEELVDEKKLHQVENKIREVESKIIELEESVPARQLVKTVDGMEEPMTELKALLVYRKDLMGKRREIMERLSKQDTVRVAMPEGQTIENILKAKYKNVYEGLPWGERFDAFIVLHTPVNSTNGAQKISDLVGNLEVSEDSLFRKAPFRSGVMVTKKINETSYELFARKYYYEYGGDKLADITLIGLVRSDRYMKETHRLDSWVISMLATLLLLCLFGLPLFKIIFMAEDERLFSSDVLSAGISVLIGAPIILVVFLAVFTYGHKYFIEIPDQLDGFTQTIAQNFTEENDKIVATLGNLDLESIRKKRNRDTVSVGGEGRYIPTSYSDLQQSEYQHFKFISLVDTSGAVDYHLNFIKAPKERTKDLSKRPYFKDYKKRKGVWYHSSEGKKAIDYVMRPVISVEDQTEEAVYITKLNEEKFIVGSVQLKSLHDAIMPLGYQLAVLDQYGNVFFHSKEGRAILEDFWSVSKRNSELQSAMAGRIEAEGLMHYHDRNQLYYLRPIPNTSLNVIVLYDIGLLRLQLSEVLTIAAFAILLAFLIASVLALISAYGKNHRRRLSKYKDFAFEFLTPCLSKERDYIYLRSKFLVVVVLAILTGIVVPLTASIAFVTSMMLIIWSYILVYYRLEPQRIMPATMLILQGRLAFWQRSVIRDWKSAVGTLHLRDWLLCIGLVLLNIGIGSLIDTMQAELYVLAVQFVFLLLLIASLVQKKHQTETPISQHATGSFKFRYSSFLFTWLIITCILPSIFYFSEAWTIEDMIWNKYDQSHVVDSYLDKRQKLLRNLTPIEAKASSELSFWEQEPYKSHLSTGTYLLNNAGIRPPKITSDDSLWTNSKESLFRKITWKFRPVYDKTIEETKPWVFNNASDMSWRSGEKDEILYRIHGSLDMTSENQKIVSFSPLSKSFMKGFSARAVLALIAGFGFIMAVLFFIILFYVDRFFGFRYQYLKSNDFDSRGPENYAGKFAQMLEGLTYTSDPIAHPTHKRGNSGLMMIGLPFTGKRDFAIEVIAHSKFKDHHAFISCLEITTEAGKGVTNDTRTTFECIMDALARDARGQALGNDGWKDKELFVIENLEHESRSVTGNRLKLQVITQLLSRHKRLIILSEVYPGQILEFFKEQVNAEGAVEEEVASDFASWRNILGEFPQVVLGMNDKPDAIEEVIQKFEHENGGKKLIPEHRASLIMELGHSRFLPSLCETILARNSYQHPDGGIAIDLERMLLHTQNLAHGYYNDIWNSLANRERYLLYDLAMDGFMNIKNGDSLFSLIKKGIIVWRDRPMVFNNSFRNFILSSAGKSEALELEQKNRKTGAWGSVRIVIYLVILALIGFLLLGEPSLIQDFKAFIGAIASIGAILPIVSGALGGGGKG